MKEPADRSDFEFARLHALHLFEQGRYEDARAVASAYLNGTERGTSGVGAMVQIGGPASAGLLRWIARAEPRLLWKFLTEPLPQLRLRVAESALFCLPLGRNRDKCAAEHTLYAAAQTSHCLDAWRATGVVKTARISNSSDGPCTACRALTGKEYRLDELPEIPHPGCTNESWGCRCGVIAVVIE